jgi:hypothetical protein
MKKSRSTHTGYSVKQKMSSVICRLFPANGNGAPRDIRITPELVAVMRNTPKLYLNTVVYMFRGTSIHLFSPTISFPGKGRILLPNPWIATLHDDVVMVAITEYAVDGGRMVLSSSVDYPQVIDVHAIDALIRDWSSFREKRRRTLDTWNRVPTPIRITDAILACVENVDVDAAAAAAMAVAEAAKLPDEAP